MSKTNQIIYLISLRRLFKPWDLISLRFNFRENSTRSYHKGTVVLVYTKTAEENLSLVRKRDMSSFLKSNQMKYNTHIQLYPAAVELSQKTMRNVCTLLHGSAPGSHLRL